MILLLLCLQPVDGDIMLSGCQFIWSIVVNTMSQELKEFLHIWYKRSVGLQDELIPFWLNGCISGLLGQQHLNCWGRAWTDSCRGPAQSWDTFLTQWRWWDTGWEPSCPLLWRTSPSPCRTPSPHWAAPSLRDWCVWKRVVAGCSLPAAVTIWFNFAIIIFYTCNTGNVLFTFYIYTFFYSWVYLLSVYFSISFCCCNTEKCTEPALVGGGTQLQGGDYWF